MTLATASWPLRIHGRDAGMRGSTYSMSLSKGLARYLLIDINNAFCKHCHYLSLHESRERGSRASWMLFTWYYHWGHIYVLERPGKLAHVLYLREGVNQGNPFLMDAYDMDIWI